MAWRIHEVFSTAVFQDLFPEPVQAEKSGCAKGGKAQAAVKEEGEV